MAVTFTVSGNPKAKERPRFGGEHVYTPQSTMNYEERVGWAYKAARGKLIDGAVSVCITLFLAVPKKASAAVRAAMLNNETPPTKKPDIDNVTKAVLDGLNGVAYKDDAQVTRLSVRKKWGAEARVEVTVDKDQGGDDK